jgi:hypothetical protein
VIAVKHAARASAVLYRVLRSRADARPFLVPVNVCPVVPLSLVAARCPFELVDIGWPHLEVDPDLCLRRVAERPGGYAGLLFVRPYGSVRDRDGFFRALKALQPDLMLVDDRCLCPPDCDGDTLSPLADVTLFSTGRRKYVDLGDGGWGFVREGVGVWREAGAPFDAGVAAGFEEDCERSVAERRPLPPDRGGWLDLRPPALPWSRHRERVGDALPGVMEHKSRLNEVYAMSLPADIQLAAPFQGWRFNVVVPAAQRLADRLFADGLFASRHYAPLAGSAGGSCHPVAEALHGSVVNLFNDLYFDVARADRACAVVRRHLELEGVPAGAARQALDAFASPRPTAAAGPAG